MKKIILLFITFSVLASCSSQKNITKGDEHFNDNYYKEAIWYYEKSAKDPKLADQHNYIYKKLAESYIGLFNYTKAAQNYEKYFENAVDPSASDYFDYAQCLRSLNKVGEAKEVMREYSRSTDNPEAKEYAKIVFDWVDESDVDGPFIMYKTNLEVGTRFSGIHLNNNEMYYSMPAEKEYDDFTSFYKIVKSGLESDDNISFKKPVDIEGIQNKNFFNGSPCIANNDQFIYYSTSVNNRIDSHNNPSYGNTYFGVDLQEILYASLEDGKFVGNIPLNFCDDKYSYSHSYITKDGKNMYFASDMPGGYGGYDIYLSVFDDYKWTEPVNLGKSVNTEQNEMFPFFNNGELYFSSFGHIGFGGSDIFVSKEKNGVYGEAINLGRPINSQYNDLGLIFTDESNKKGYLASSRDNDKGIDEVFYISKQSPDKVTIFTDLKDEELEKAVPLELWKKYGNSYKLIDSKTAAKEGTEFTMEKGITYKVKAIVDDQEHVINDEVKINPKNREEVTNLKIEWDLPEIEESVANTLDAYVDTYKDNPKADKEFKSYIKAIEIETGIYVVNGVFSNFSNAVNTMIATQEDFGMKSTTIRYNKEKGYYYVMLYIGKDTSEAKANLKALHKQNYFKDAWLFRVE